MPMLMLLRVEDAGPYVPGGKDLDTQIIRSPVIMVTPSLKRLINASQLLPSLPPHSRDRADK